MYYPQTYGIYNVQLKEFAGDSASNLAQQFTYSASRQAMLTKLHEKTSLFEGFNKNVITYADQSLNNQKFSYNRNTKIIMNTVTEQALSIQKDQEGEALRIGQNVVTRPLDLADQA